MNDTVTTELLKLVVNRLVRLYGNYLHKDRRCPVPSLWVKLEEDGIITVESYRKRSSNILTSSHVRELEIRWRKSDRCQSLHDEKDETWEVFLQLKSALKDAELSRSEAEEALTSVGELAVKTTSIIDVENSDIADNRHFPWKKECVCNWFPSERSRFWNTNRIFVSQRSTLLSFLSDEIH